LRRDEMFFDSREFGTLRRGAGSKTHAAMRWEDESMGRITEPLCNCNPDTNNKHTWSDDITGIDCKACIRSITGDNWKPGYAEQIKAAFGY